MKNQYSLKLIGTLLAISGMGYTANAQTRNPSPVKVHVGVRSPQLSAHIRSVTVGDSLKIHVRATASDTFSLSIIDTSGAVVLSSTVTGGVSVLGTLPVGDYEFSLLGTDSTQTHGKFEVKAPHVHADIRSITIGDTLNIHVRADSTESFTLAISDTSGVVQTVTVTGGSTTLPALPVGKYSYTLTDAAGYVVDKGKFAVKAPHVHADIRSITIGDTLNIRVRADSTESFTLAISDTSGVVQTVTVIGGSTSLPALSVGKYSYTLTDAAGYVVNTGKFEVKAPKVHADIRSITAGDTLKIRVRADSTESFTLAISDTSGVVQTVTVIGGSTSLPALPVGKYSYTLTDAAGYVVNTGKFEVKAPKVHADIRSITIGDTLNIRVRANSTESFTLAISDTSGVVQTVTVTGGSTTLPALPVGKYSYTLTDAAGYVVNTGKFEVKAPHVHAHVNFNRFNSELNIHVHASSTESFTLNVTDTSGAVVLTATVSGGTTQLDSLPLGKYEFTLTNTDGIQVEKGKFEVKSVLVQSSVYPNPSAVGEGSIIINAPATETFTLLIYSGASTPAYNGPVNGGTTLLPDTLSAGMYHYRVINADGDIVSKGKILIIR